MLELTSNPQPPITVMTDSQAIMLTAHDFSGKALTFRHQRR